MIMIVKCSVLITGGLHVTQNDRLSFPQKGSEQINSIEAVLKPQAQQNSDRPQ